MKIKLLLSLALLCGTSIIYAQSTNCSRFYPMDEGTSFEYTSYNKKGKTEGKSSYKVTSVENDGDTTVATMDISFEDQKGKKVYDTNYSFSCTGNMVTVDYESLVPQQMLTQYEDMEMEITGTDIELPNDLGVGQELEDANVTLKMNMGGISMNTTVDMVNRKVEKKENVTTPAGTFECFVLYSENQSKVMMAKSNFPSRVWLAEGVGMVKQETYKKNGDLMNSTELTKFSK
ncbi:hypothetical protein EJ994_17055 [Maribacter sp. MJ134]|uniref:TapB family protein n=1 Tax=Maribacter sp. MJ134 TaxID=2496865 RepID=UPI000F848F60|nr:hypothetical protein [Maribacter sp. MJ134]AZQ60426.1 hypothetical protein EJ994_17055 [Maribacter sp. MJ134]